MSEIWYYCESRPLFIVCPHSLFVNLLFYYASELFLLQILLVYYCDHWLLHKPRIVQVKVYIILYTLQYKFTYSTLAFIYNKNLNSVHVTYWKSTFTISTVQFILKIQECLQKHPSAAARYCLA